ncbi:hypothetical protein GCM10018965_004130 [Nonomuraea roseola]
MCPYKAPVQGRRGRNGGTSSGREAEVVVGGGGGRSSDLEACPDEGSLTGGVLVRQCLRLMRYEPEELTVGPAAIIFGHDLRAGGRLRHPPALLRVPGHLSSTLSRT